MNLTKLSQLIFYIKECRDAEGHKPFIIIAYKIDFIASNTQMMTNVERIKKKAENKTDLSYHVSQNIKIDTTKLIEKS